MKKVIIILLCLLVLGLGGYLAYDKFFNKLDNNTEEEIVEKDFDKVEAKKIVDKYYYGYVSNNLFTNGMTDYAKFYITLKDLNAKKVSCDEIYENNSRAKKDESYGNSSYTVTLDSGLLAYCDDTTETLSYEEVNKEYKYLFGKDQEVKKSSKKLFISTYDYDENGDKFVSLNCRCGMEFGPFQYSSYVISSAKEYGNTLTLDVGYFEIKTSDEEKYYSYEISGNREFSRGDFDSPTFDSDFFNQYSEKIPKYRLTFEKEDNHYVFKNLVKLLS